MCVVGYGAMGRHHARNLAALPGVDLVGVVEPLGANSEEAKRNGLRTFDSVAAVLAEGIDAAVVSVPTSAHYDVALRLIDAGCAILVEKPIATDVAAGNEIIEAAARRQVPLMVGYVERYNPAVVAVRNFMAAGGLGRIYSLSARRVGLLPPRIKDANVLVDIGVHDIDLAAFLLDSDLVLLAAQGGKAVLEDRVDYATLSLDANGIAVHINVNWITPVKIRELFITGEHGLVHVDYMLQTARFAPGHKAPVPTTYEGLLDDYTSGEFVQLPIEKEEPLRRELRTFIDGVRTGNLPDVRISLESLRVAERATLQIEAGYKEQVSA